MNTLYYGDNLKILREYIANESVDLIYLDPPFNSKADYNILFREPTGTSSEAQITAFEDTWHWTEETEKAFQDIIGNAPFQVVEMITAFRKFIRQNDMMAYLTMMTIRLLELHRVLKQTGNIYLHCDPKASHYLKIVLDTIFGVKNFRNEIVWCYTGPSRAAKDFPRKHDILFRYVKSEDWYFNKDAENARTPYSDSFLARRKHKEGEGGIFKGYREDDHDVSEFQQGKIVEDWWTDIPSGGQISRKELLGYPTQKPLKLLLRIIETSSPEDGLILDPFCGCGTTITAAQMLNRKWMGIDVTHLAIHLIKRRLKYMFGLEPKKNYNVIGEPEDFAGAKELASQNRYQFQWWALSFIDFKLYEGKKKGADTGIDGYDYFAEGKNEFKKIVAQVKSGHVSVKDIREFGHVIDREKAEIGIFVTLERPTRQMTKEAVEKGFYKLKMSSNVYPKIQILTVEELFNGMKPNLPPRPIPYKKADRVDLEQQLGIDINGDDL